MRLLRFLGVEFSLGYGVVEFRFPGLLLFFFFFFSFFFFFFFGGGLEFSNHSSTFTAVSKNRYKGVRRTAACFVSVVGLPQKC